MFDKYEALSQTLLFNLNNNIIMEPMFSVCVSAKAQATRYVGHPIRADNGLISQKL